MNFDSSIHCDTKKIGVRAYLFVTENPLHVLELDAFVSNQAMLNAYSDFSPNKSFSSDVRFFKDIVRFDHDTVNRILLGN